MTEVHGELANFTQAIAVGGDVETLCADVSERLADWQGLLRREPPVARQILPKVLSGRLIFEPREEEDGGRFYAISGDATLAHAVAGNNSGKTLVAPTGFARTCRIQVRNYIAR